MSSQHITHLGQRFTKVRLLFTFLLVTTLSSLLPPPSLLFLDLPGLHRVPGGLTEDPLSSDLFLGFPTVDTVLASGHIILVPHPIVAIIVETRGSIKVVPRLVVVPQSAGLLIDHALLLHHAVGSVGHSVVCHVSVGLG